ncbi:MAG: hypothetical protein CR974_00300 [Gammaproteobacteria bacterium]|nr:MAG: hypothetical protein CR974_00300 [Gammaproteobacteria bacterium]
MNKIYKVVYCKATQTFVAVSEFAKAKGKSSRCTSRLPSHFLATSPRFQLTKIALALMSALSLGGLAYASNPAGTVESQYANAGGGQIVILGNAKTVNPNTDNGAKLGAQSINIGNDVFAEGDSSIAIGGDDTVTASDHEMTYTEYDKDGNPTGTVTKSLKALFEDSTGVTGVIAAKWPQTKTGHGAVAVGVSTQALGGLSTAFGVGAKVEEKAHLGLALGAGAVVTKRNAVAIGAGAQTDVTAKKETEAVIARLDVNGNETGEFIHYKDFAGGADNLQPGDYISFGKAGYERQLKNVAAGRVAPDSTDAVNGSQLVSLGKALQKDIVTQSSKPITFTGNVNSDTDNTASDGTQRKLGETLKIHGGLTGNSSNSNIKTIVTNGDIDIQFADAPTFAGKVSAVGLDAGGQKVTNVKKGENDADAVNYEQLKELEDKINNVNNNVVDLETNSPFTFIEEGSKEQLVRVKDGNDYKFYKASDVDNGQPKPNANPVDAKKVVTSALGSTGDAHTPQRIVNIADGKDANDAVNVSQLKNSAWHLFVDGQEKNGGGVKQGDKVKFVDGKNTDVVVNSDNGTDTEIQINVKADGKVKADTKGGIAVDGLGDNLVNATTLADAISKAGFTAKANGDAGELIHAGDTIDLKDGKNIKVTRDGSNFTFATKDDVEFNNVKVGDVVINQDTGINAGNKQINNLASAGDISDANNANKAVNAGDLNTAINNAGFIAKATANGGVASGSEDKLINTGKTLEFVAGEHVTIEQEGGKFTFKTNNQAILNDAQQPVVYTKADGTKVYKVGDKFYDNPAGTGAEVPKGNVITSIQGADGSTTNPSTLANVKSNLPATTNTGTPTKTQAAPTHAAGNNAATVDDVLNAGWNLKNNADDIDFVKPYDTVNFVNGQGTTAKVTTDNEESKVSFDINVDDNTLELAPIDASDPSKGSKIQAKTGDIVEDTANTGKVKTKAGDENKVATAGDVADAINAASHKIKGTNTDVMASAQDGEKVLRAGEELTFEAGKNLNLQADGNKFIFSTKNDVDFNNVKVGDVVINKDAGINAGNKKIANIAAGTDDGDAVNVKQLQDTVNDAKPTLVKGSHIASIDKQAGTGTTGDTWTINAEGTTVSAGSTAVSVKPATDSASNTTDYIVDLSQDTKGAIQKALLTEEVTAGKGVKVTKTDATATAGAQFEVAVQIDDITTELKDGKVVAKTGDIVENSDGSVGEGANPNSLTTAKDVASAINNAGFTVKTVNGDGGKNQLVTMGDTVIFDEGKNIDVVQANGKFTIATKDTVTFSEITLGDATNSTKLTSTPEGLDIGGDKITNVAAGTAAGDAVNFSQLKAATTEVAGGTNVASVDKTTGAAGQNIYTVNADGASVSSASDDRLTVKKGNKDSNNITDYEIDLGQKAKESLAKADTAIQEIVTQIDGAPVKTLTQGNNTANFITGDNMELTPSNEGIKIATKKDVSFNSVTAGPVTINNNGIDAGGQKITNVQAATENGDAVNFEQLKSYTANLDQINATLVKQNSPFTYIGKDANDKDITLERSVENGKVVYKHNGVVVTPDPTDIRISTIDPTMGNVGVPTLITNVKDGVKPNDAVNVSQLENSAWHLFVDDNEQNGEGVKQGDKVKFADGKNTDVTVKSDNTTDTAIQFDVVAKGKLDNTDGKAALGSSSGDDLVNAGNLVDAINNTGWNLKNNGAQQDLVTAGNGVDFIDGAGTNAVVKTANDVSTITFDINADNTTLRVDPTSKKLTAVTGDILTNSNGTVGAGGQPDALTTAKEVAEAINSASHTIAGKNSDAVATAANGKKVITAGETLAIEAGNNLNLKVDGDTFLLSTAEEVDFNSVTAGNVKVGPVSIDKTSGINAGGTSIKGVKAGVDDTDAVNVSQLKTLTNAATATVSSADPNKVDVKTITNGDGSKNYQIDVLTTALSNAGNGSVNTPAEPDSLATAGDIAQAINSAGWNVQNNGVQKDLVTAGNAVNFVNGANTQAVVSVDANHAVSEVTFNVTGLPIQYTTTAGKPVAKVGDKYYEVDVNGKPDMSKPVADASTLVASTISPTASPNAQGSPTVLNNLASHFDGAKAGTVAPTKQAIAPTNVAGMQDQAATVGDVLNAGWNLSINNGATTANHENVDFVTPYNEVEFNAGTGVVASKTTDGNTSTITYQLATASEITVQAWQNQAQNTEVDSNSGAVTIPANDPNKGNGVVSANTVAKAINNSGWNITSDITGTGQQAGTQTTELVKPSEIVALTAGDNMVIAQDGQNFIYSVSDKPVFKAVTATDGLTIGLGTTAINLKPVTTTALDNAGNSNTQTPAIDMGGATFTGVASNLPDTTQSTQQAAPADVVGSNVASVDDVLNSGWNLQVDGKAKDFVKSYDTVNFKGENGITVEHDASGTTNNITIGLTKGSVSSASTGGASGDGGFITGDQVADAVNQSGFTLTASGANGSVVNPGESVDMKNTDGNIVISKFANSNDVDYNLNKDLKGLNSIVIGDVLGDDAVSISTAGVNAGNKQVTNVASGLGGRSIEAIKADGNTAPEWNNAATIGDLTQVQNNVNNVTNVTNNYQNTLGDTFVNADGTLSDEGQLALKTYNVDGQGEYHHNSVISAVKNMNEQGIKFFHVNDGVVKSVDDSGNTVDSSAAGKYATAIGYQASVGKAATNGVAIGKGATVSGENSIAIGTGNVVSGKNSGAFGDPNVVSGNASYAVGNDNKVTTDNTLVFGNSVTSTVKNSVILGNQSASTAGNAIGTKNIQADGTEGNTTTAGDTGTVKSATVGDLTYGGFAGAEAHGVVSVGASGSERRIQNVAAGEISATSTDAINGSQLYQAVGNLNYRLGDLNYRLNDVAEDANAGTAAGIAAANLPQPHDPGKSMVSAGLGYYEGETALAVGASTISDNGKWILKGSLSIDTQSNAGVGAAVGYQW